MKKKYTAAVLLAAMLVASQKLPSRASHAHAEGGEGHAGEVGTPEQPNAQETEEAASSEPVRAEEPKQEEQKPEPQPEPKEEPKPEPKPEPKEEPKPETKAEEKPEVKAEPEAEEKPETKDETEAEEKAETKDETEAEEKPETKDETEAEEKPETKDETEAEEKPETKDETEAEEKPEAKDESETEAKENPETTQAPEKETAAETPAPAQETEEQERQLPALLAQIEEDGYAYVKTAGSGVKLYDSEWMNRRLGTIENGQSVLLALGYEETETDQFAVYVVFGCGGQVMDGYVRLSNLDGQTLDGEAFIREHENSAVRSDDYPLVNVEYTPKEEEKQADASEKKEEQPKESEAPKATVAPEATAAPETTPEVTPTPEPTEEPLDLPPIPARVERNGYAYVRTAELEVKLYTDENLDQQFASIYEKGAVLLVDGYAEREDAKNYALHVYVADENGVVDGYVSLKRMIKTPMDETPSGEESVDGLPVVKTKVKWKKNDAAKAKQTATPKPTETPAPTATPAPAETPKQTEVSAATFEQKHSAATLEQTNPNNSDVSVLPIDGSKAERPVVVGEDELPTDDLTPTPVIVWPDPADDNKNADNGIALPILDNEERPVAGIDLPTDDLTPTEIITWPEPTTNPNDGDAEPGENGEDGKTDEQPELEVVVLVDAPENELVPEGATVNFTAYVKNADDADKLLYQWQSSRDGQTWENVDGANGQSYDVMVTAANADCYWRVVVNREKTTGEE